MLPIINQPTSYHKQLEESHAELLRLLNNIECECRRYQQACQKYTEEHKKYIEIKSQLIQNNLKMIRAI